MFKKPEVGDLLEITGMSGRSHCALILELQGSNIIILHDSGKIGWIDQREYAKWSGEGHLRLRKSS